MVSELRTDDEASRRPSEIGAAVWAVVAAFGAYFSMYLFRKPFTAATFEGMKAFGIDFKTLLVTSQVIGYFLSKLIGIKVVSEMPPHRRAMAVLGLVLAAETALLLFAVVPAPWNILFLFLNGLPLGMVFGLVVAFLEGRRLTELLTAGLCVSFILADGAAKSLGTFLLNSGVSPFWMPFTAGLVGLAPLSLFTWMLSRITPPTAADLQARCERTVMTAADRKSLCARHAVGIGAIILSFVLCTVLRSLRADFAPELWKGLGYLTAPHTFTTSETLVALGVLIVSGLSVLVRDNRKAFFLSLAICFVGFLILLAAIIASRAGALSPMPTMVLFGLGLYLPYVAVHTTVFERMLAMTREKGTLAFLITLADSAGYFGYIGVMIARNIIAPEGRMLTYFQWLAGVSAVVSLASLVVAFQFFARRPDEATPLVVEPTAS
jgi:hypothetical protein